MVSDAQEMNLHEHIALNCVQRYKAEINRRVNACIKFHQTNKAWDKPHDFTTASVKEWVALNDAIPSTDKTDSPRLWFGKLLDAAAWKAQNKK